MKGVVYRLKIEQAYGFIRGEDGRTEYFFHKKDCLPDCRYEELNEGDKVQFEPEEDTKGPHATDVTYA